MVGYVGLESIVYHAFMRIMEQVEGGDILVRKGSEVKQRDAVDEGGKDLNVCEGFAEAIGIAKVNKCCVGENREEIEDLNSIFVCVNNNYRYCNC